MRYFFFFQAEDGIRDGTVTGVQTCALPIWRGTLLHARLRALVDPPSNCRHYPSMLRRRAPSGRPRGWASESVWDLRGGAAMSEQGVSRRELFRWGGVLALPALLRAKGAEAAAAATTGLRA